ncbi:hypothetical protein EJD97_004545 [Solanum chilense]|uniref:Uncharacterized protein n=1 Tax=Solanum chilense TaxID=4083 RepID=A0A6N2BWZ2_SOLCI|nr:hypothetical protein EJD97_004545 [Solanum chilense]
MNGIVALHSPPIRKDAAKKNGTLFLSVGCIGSHITMDMEREQAKRGIPNGKKDTTTLPLCCTASSHS